jgi:ribose transport system substrate-binding protein
MHMQHRARGVSLLLLFLLLGCGADSSADPVSGGAGARKIAVIPKGTTHVFWKSVERGAKRAGEELGVEIVWKGPLKENDRAQQIQLVQNFATQGVAGMVLAPLDFKALLAPVQAAMQKDIPVVIIDSALEGTAPSDFVSFVATNNETGGRLGGEHLAGLLPDGGKIVLLRYQAGSASTTNREKGFLDAIGAQEHLEVISENRFAGPRRRRRRST